MDRRPHPHPYPGGRGGQQLAKPERPVIDRRIPLSEIIAAFRYLEDTLAQGKVVITVE
jgi:hypothetical protein